MKELNKPSGSPFLFYFGEGDWMVEHVQQSIPILIGLWGTKFPAKARLLCYRPIVWHILTLFNFLLGFGCRLLTHILVCVNRWRGFGGQTRITPFYYSGCLRETAYFGMCLNRRPERKWCSFGVLFIHPEKGYHPTKKRGTALWIPGEVLRITSISSASGSSKPTPMT